MKTKPNLEKIKELLQGSVQDKALAVCMIRQQMSLGETVKLLSDWNDDGALSEMIVLAVYPLPLYIRKGGVKSITFSEIKKWAAKSPNVRPARNTFGVKITKTALERYLGLFSTKDVYLQMLGHG